MKVRKLQRAGESEYQWHVLRDVGRGACRNDVGRRTGGDAARQRDVVMDIEFKDVIEGV